MRPLSYRDVEAMLIRLGDSTSGIVLVGGQAVNFWAEQYLPRAPELGTHAPYTSKTIDFCGTRAAVVECAHRLGGRALLPVDFDPTPNSGQVVFLDDTGTEHIIDFLTPRPMSSSSGSSAPKRASPSSSPCSTTSSSSRARVASGASSTSPSSSASPRPRASSPSSMSSARPPRAGASYLTPPNLPLVSTVRGHAAARSATQRQTLGGRAGVKQGAGDR